MSKIETTKDEHKTKKKRRDERHIYKEVHTINQKHHQKLVLTLKNKKWLSVVFTYLQSNTSGQDELNL